mgnify:CR=1 FL=1
MKKKEKGTPGQIQLTSQEVEWLYTTMRNTCQLADRSGTSYADYGDRFLPRLVAKLALARYPDAVEIPMVKPDEIVTIAHSIFPR